MFERVSGEQGLVGRIRGLWCRIIDTTTVHKHFGFLYKEQFDGLNLHFTVIEADCCKKLSSGTAMAVCKSQGTRVDGILLPIYLCALAFMNCLAMPEILTLKNWPLLATFYLPAMLSIHLGNINISSEQFLTMLGVEPRAAGWEASMLFTVLCRPPNIIHF